MKTARILTLTILIYNILQNCFAQYPDTIYQKVSPVQEFTKEAMLVIFKVTDKQGLAVKNIQVRLWDKNSNKIYAAYTDDIGVVRFKVPAEKKYTIGIENLDNYRETTVKYQEGGIVAATFLPYVPSKISETDINDTITQKLPYRPQPTSDRVLVNIKLKNYEDKNLPGENVFINDVYNKKVYVNKTDEFGNAFFLLPSSGTYTAHFTLERDISTLDFGAVRSFYIYQMDYQYEGTETILKRVKDKEHYLKERDSLYEIYLKTTPEAGQSDFIYQLSTRDVKKVLQSINDRAMKEKAELEKDPKFFEKGKREIEAVLYRMKDKWTNKIIVTDITGSMNPYMDQVLLWHAMQIAGNTKSHYYFFNDGDNTPDSNKIIGKTGGIYNINTASLDTLLNMMYKGICAGNGGDGPENDLEALLAASKKFPKNTVLILIADNYSNVKDISLLSQLNIPIHVIICGAGIGINEDYLQIAYKTNGTVHTIEKDIDMMQRIADGSILTFDGKKYRFNRGKFFLMN